MANITVSGKVTGSPDKPAVTVMNFKGKNGMPDSSMAFFNVLDGEYAWSKEGEDRVGQFYKCEVRGKLAEICVERIERGDPITVSGQLVYREYQGKTYLDIKNGRVTFLKSNQTSSSERGASMQASSIF